MEQLSIDCLKFFRFWCGFVSEPEVKFCNLFNFLIAEPSIDRQRQTFERRELELMAEVRDLRQRLAARRQQRPPDMLGSAQQ